MTRGAALLAWILASSAPAWAGDVSVRGATAGVSLDPGRAASAGVRVANRSADPVIVAERLELPPGWRSLTAPGSFTLAGGEERTQILGFSVPNDTPANVYEIRYSVDDSDEAAVFQVRVLPVRGVTLEPLDEPMRMLAGEEQSTRMLVRNHGNDVARLTFEAQGDDVVEARVVPAELVLGPGEVGTVEVVASSSRATARYETHPVRVTAHSDGEDPLRVGAVVWVPVVPRRMDGGDLMRRVPITASVRGTAGAQAVGAQVDVEGAGAVDEARTVHVSGRLRGPDMRHTGAFGRHDEYRVSLDAPTGSLRIGDQVYGLTPLLSMGRYGRGAEVAARLGPATLGAYYASSRFRARGLEEIGGWAAVGGDRGAVQASVLRQWEEGVAPSTSIGLRSERRFGWAHVAGEIATSLSDEGGAPGMGFRLEAGGRSQQGFAFDLMWTRADAAFRGWFRDQDLVVAGFTAPLPGRSSLRASVIHRSDRLGQEVARTTSVARTGLYVRPVEKVQVGFAGDVAARGLGASLTAHSLSVAARGSVRWSGRHHAAFVESVLAWQDAPGQGFRGWAHQHSANLAVHPTRRQTLGVYGAWVSGAEESLILQRGAMIGAFFDWEPIDGLFVDVRGERGLTGFTGDLLDGRLGYRWGGGYAVTARTQVRAFKGRSDPITAGELVVTVPIGVPVGRRTDVGMVRGRLVDEGTGRGLGHVPLAIGDVAVVTDRRGRFSSGALAPGEHMVSLRPGDLGMDRVPTRPLPLPVTVRGGERLRLDLGAADGATLRARIVAPDGAPYRGVRVVATSGDARQIGTTDADGWVAFRGLAPGAWLATPVSADLPPFSRVEGAVAVDLVAGGLSEVSVAVRSDARVMSVVDVDQGAPLVVHVRPPAVPAVAPAPEPGPSAPRTAPGPVVAAPPVAPPARRIDPSRILPLCFEALGAVWVGDAREHDGDGLPVIPADRLEDVLADPSRLLDHAVSTP